MFCKRFVIETLERAVKSAAQYGLLTFGGDYYIATVDGGWSLVLTAAIGAFIVSVLTSIASKPLGPDDGSPSVV